MDFEWDEAKSETCLVRRGFDFAYVVHVFRDPNRLVEIDDRFDYGETRYRVPGRIDGLAFMVVYTPRRGVLRIISARRANRKEITRYGQATVQT
jgi:uncharacterized DUF497 family protein